MSTGGRAARREQLDALDRRGLRLLRPGQVVLAASLFALLLALVSTSWISVSAHDAELEGLFSEEADGTAMTFAQRESFGVVLEVDDWTRGDATARDVQIARALLGQRLQVVTASGLTTFELTEAPYQRALEAVDEVVRELEDVPVAERPAVRSALDPVLDEFETRSRELSAIFQRLTRERATEAIGNRTAVEQLQAGLSAVLVVLGLTLAVWLSADLRASYRLASLRLRAETRRLSAARRSLDLRESLQELGRAWADSLTVGTPFDELAARVRDDLARLLPHVRLVLVDDDRSPRLEVSGLAGSGAGASGPMPSRSDVAAALARANESLRLARQRDRREERWQLERQTDALTGLPNRERLSPVLAEALVAATALEGAVVALALVDLDRFADFNSSFGHAEGDRLLVEVARRLAERCHDGRTVLRLSADEFAVVGVHADQAGAHASIAALASELPFTHQVDGQSAEVAVTIGAVVSPPDGRGPDPVIQRAAAALASAQQTEPRVPVRFFDGDRDEHLLAVMHEESALRSALRSGEFVMHFQPIIDLASGRLAACEALVRWNRPGVGLLAPGEFLPAIERAGLAVELGWQVIDQALEAWAGVRADAAGALDDVRLAINVEASQLRVSTLADYLVNAAERTGVPLDRLVVEVTEHALLSGDEPVAQLSDLRSRGLRVALDDFGTGYSSLAQATALPLDALKIDRSFVPDAELDGQQRALLRDIVSFASTLGLAVTAEGIESPSVADALRELGVDYGQGWHWARAMPVSELLAWLALREPELSAR